MGSGWADEDVCWTLRSAGVVNTNGLLHQYFPKRKPLSLEQATLDAVADELNGRPRQTLDWLTPSQTLDQVLR